MQVNCTLHAAPKLILLYGMNKCIFVKHHQWVRPNLHKGYAHMKSHPVGIIMMTDLAEETFRNRYRHL